MHRALRSLLTRRAFVGAIPTALPAFCALARAGEPPPTPSSVFRRAAPPVTSADQVVNVMEFEALARDALPPAHFGYIATGADDDRTVVRNHEAFSHYEIRARRFNDVRNVVLKTSVFGVSWPSPFIFSRVWSCAPFPATPD